MPPRPEVSHKQDSWSLPAATLLGPGRDAQARSWPIFPLSHHLKEGTKGPQMRPATSFFKSDARFCFVLLCRRPATRDGELCCGWVAAAFWRETGLRRKSEGTLNWEHRTLGSLTERGRRLDGPVLEQILLVTGRWNSLNCTQNCVRVFSLKVSGLPKLLRTIHLTSHSNIHLNDLLSKSLHLAIRDSEITIFLNLFWITKIRNAYCPF